MPNSALQIRLSFAANYASGSPSLMSHISHLQHHPAFLQEIRLNGGSTDVVAPVEMNLYELSEPRAVMIPQRFCISKSLQDGVRLQFKREVPGKRHCNGWRRPHAVSYVIFHTNALSVLCVASPQAPDPQRQCHPRASRSTAWLSSSSQSYLNAYASPTYMHVSMDSRRPSSHLPLMPFSATVT